MINNDKPFNLIDGANGQAAAVVREVQEQRRISRDPNIPLERRLEAYEDILDSEVGDTTLVRARNREWVVLPESEDGLLMVPPLGGTDAEITGILTELEPVESACARSI